MHFNIKNYLKNNYQKFTSEVSSMYITLYTKAAKNQVVMIFNLDRSTNDQSPK